MVEHYENTWTLQGKKNGRFWKAKGITVSSIILPTVISLDYTGDYSNLDSREQYIQQRLSRFHGWSGSSGEPGHGESNIDNYFSDGNISFTFKDRENLTAGGTVSANSTETKRVGGNIRFSKNEQEFGNTYLNPSMTYGLALTERNSNIDIASNDIEIEVKIIGRKMT